MAIQANTRDIHRPDSAYNDVVASTSFTIPQNLDAEARVIGTLCIHPWWSLTKAADLEPEDFYRPAWQRLLPELRDMAAAVPFVATVWARARRIVVVAAVRVDIRLTDIEAAMENPTAELEAYVKTLREVRHRRERVGALLTELAELEAS